ncbi:hypothetical protein [Hymenobacter lapidiphilus]|uniref:DUF5673 domain-containing protein n=1 Tax=Hymenobacter lapidiphilus TaxID=2608003 RepID=A0A7Y7U612_9BACT|nr:hypothetical protein [Hymenobacter lapidiphilus]NVO31304.1 hypothetical protein [Hymenobacter lapidiphilus]
MEPYKYEFHYSRSSIFADLVLGAFVLFIGIVLCFWSKIWVGVLCVLVGGFGVWRVILRGLASGPQLKIGQQGLWTVSTGALKWSEAIVKIEHELTSKGMSIAYVVLRKRKMQNQELARFRVDDLDVDPKSLPFHIRECMRK